MSIIWEHPKRLRKHVKSSSTIVDSWVPWPAKTPHHHHCFPRANTSWSVSQRFDLFVLLRIRLLPLTGRICSRSCVPLLRPLLDRRRFRGLLVYATLIIRAVTAAFCSVATAKMSLVANVPVNGSLRCVLACVRDRMLVVFLVSFRLASCGRAPLPPCRLPHRSPAVATIFALPTHAPS